VTNLISNVAKMQKFAVLNCFGDLVSVLQPIETKRKFKNLKKNKTAVWNLLRV
jgi:hypothetical protein